MSRRSNWPILFAVVVSGPATVTSSRQSPLRPVHLSWPITVIRSLQLAAHGRGRQSLHIPNPKPWHGSNVSLILRRRPVRDVQRSGQVLLSKNLLGPTKSRATASTATSPAFTGEPGQLEDPVVCSAEVGTTLLVNAWGTAGVHLISRDGISHWMYQGVAYYPEADFIRYTNGQVNTGTTERPGVTLNTARHRHHPRGSTIPRNRKTATTTTAARSSSFPSTAPPSIATSSRRPAR